MKDIFQFVLREVFYMGHLQALGAAVIVYVSSAIFGINPSMFLLLATYCAFQAIYYYDRYRDIDHDKETNSARTQHLKIYHKYLPGFIFLLLAFLSAFLLISSPIPVVIFFLVVVLMGILYPLFFKALTARFPLFKNFYVASVFAALVFLPSLYVGTIISTNLLVATLVGFVFSESIITQFVLDIKDMSSDARQGLRTLLTSVGEKIAVRYIIVLSLLVVLSVLSVDIWFGLPQIIVILAISSLLFNLLTLWLVVTKKKSGSILASAKYIVWGFLVLSI